MSSRLSRRAKTSKKRRRTMSKRKNLKRSKIGSTRGQAAVPKAEGEELRRRPRKRPLRRRVHRSEPGADPSPSEDSRRPELDPSIPHVVADHEDSEQQQRHAYGDHEPVQVPPF